MPRRLRQQAHRRTEQQREHDQNTHSIERIAIVVIDCRRRDRRIATLQVRKVRDRGGVGQMVQSHHRDDEQDEDDKCDEYVDKLVDARTAVEGDVLAISFRLELWCAKVFLDDCQLTITVR